ncbi:MAG: DUF4131 domain-containing protein [Lachnospiraceae bacterium]|nr:DUF4131 domain-containing protein [Lachnospiraceae bacterium]
MLIKRPLLWYAGAYALGEVLARRSEGLWPAALCLAAGMAGAIVGFRLKGKKNGQGRQKIWLVLPAFFLLGFWRICQEGDSPAIQELDRRLELEGRLEAELSGQIERIEFRKVEAEESFRLYLSGCRVQMKGKETEETERFFVGGVLLFWEELPEGVQEGRTISAKVRLMEMEEARNPGQFDSRSYYRSQGIAYQAKGRALLDVSGRTDYLRLGLRTLRRQFVENLLKTAGEKQGGMLCAMVLGEKWAADKESVSLYEESGMGHLLAISGLHISLAGMGVYHLIRKFFRGSYVLGAAGCTGMSFCYYLLTGEGTSAGRALLMLTVYGIGQVLGRQYDLACAAAGAALLMLLRRPLLLFQCGFLLSFGSVLALGLLYPLFCREKFPKILGPVLPGLSIQLVTLPVQASFFYRLPVYSLILNLAVLPLFTAAALLGIAGALFGGSLPGVMSILLFPARGILWLYEFLGEQSLCLPGAVWRTGKPEEWQLWLYGTLLLLLGRQLGKREIEKRETEDGGKLSNKMSARKGRVLCRKDRKKGLCKLLLLSGLLFCLAPIPFRGVELTFLDVGQGDSCFLRTAEGFTFFIDGGSSDKRNIGEYCLEPFLDFQAVGQVDFALLSHGDADHINGISELMEKGRIGALILPQRREEGEGLAAIREKAEQAKIPVFFLGQGERMRIGEATFTCLWPESRKEVGEDGAGFSDENETSMVLWFSWRELDVLFTGDLEGRGEEAVTTYLEERHSDRSKASVDILKVSHHGSGGASSLPFLKATAPGYGIISCGRNNRYGHPAKDTLERLERFGCQIFRTDQGGAVTVRSDGKRMEIYR